MECDMSYVLLVVAVSVGSEHGTDGYRTKRIQIVMIQCRMGLIFYRLLGTSISRTPTRLSSFLYFLQLLIHS